MSGDRHQTARKLVTSGQFAVAWWPTLGSMLILLCSAAALWHYYVPLGPVQTMHLACKHAVRSSEAAEELTFSPAIQHTHDATLAWS